MVTAKRCRNMLAPNDLLSGGLAEPTALPVAANGGDDVGKQDGQHEQGARDDVQRLPGDVFQAQRVLQRGQQHHAGEDAGQAALSAEDRYAAQQDGGDDGELETGAVVGAGAGVAQCPQHSDQAGNRAADDVQPELGTRDPDAGEVRGLGVGADGVQRAADRGGVQDHPEDHRHRDDRDQYVGYGAVADRSGDPAGEVEREVGHRGVAEDDEGEAAVEGQGADGDRERGQTQPGDQEPVERPGDRPDQDAERDDR